MENKQIAIIILILGIIIVGYAIYNSFNKTTVSVQGQSEIKADPEFLTVYFQASYSADSAQEAGNKLAEQIDSLKTNLFRAGVSSDSIQTENYNVRQTYPYEHQKAFVAEEQISVKTKKFYDAGKIVDAGINANVLVSYINFEISQEKQNELKAESLKQAAEDAKLKAQALALGSGKKLGKLVKISTSDFYYQPYPLYDRATGSAAEVQKAVTDISPKELEITSTVSAIYEIY